MTNLGHVVRGVWSQFVHFEREDNTNVAFNANGYPCTRININGIKQSLAPLQPGERVNKDIMYANILAHEVFYHAINGHADPINGTTNYPPGTLTSAQPAP